MKKIEKNKSQNAPKSRKGCSDKLVIFFYLLVGLVLFLTVSSMPLHEKRIFIVVAPLVIALVIWGIILVGISAKKYNVYTDGKRYKLDNVKYDTGWQKSTAKHGKRLDFGIWRRISKIKWGKGANFEATIDVENPFLGIGSICSIGYLIFGLIWLANTYK